MLWSWPAARSKNHNLLDWRSNARHRSRGRQTAFELIEFSVGLLKRTVEITVIEVARQCSAILIGCDDSFVGSTSMPQSGESITPTGNVS